MNTQPTFKLPVFRSWREDQETLIRYHRALEAIARLNDSDATRAAIAALTNQGAK
jgi:hypothetical protein